MRRIELLDCTLRDGSYVVDFQFTARQTAEICGALEAAGFTRIEVGHGVGMGASGPQRGVAACTDEEYIRAAVGALTHTKPGAYFIPGIATEEHLRMGRDLGLQFIRIGTDITRSEQADPFIATAKRLGFEVHYNAQKSYLAPPDEFLRRAVRLEEAGIDVMYVTDSAGGMMPAQVRDYVTPLAAALKCRIGFHGHNNLSLAVANTLAALEAGATLLDCTLQGIGRSGGNAQGEVMALLLERMGIDAGIDVARTLAAGETLVRPLMPEAYGIPAVDAVMGFAQFHSGFYDRLRRIAEETGVDAKTLIVEVSREDRANPGEELIRSIAGRLAQPASV